MESCIRAACGQSRAPALGPHDRPVKPAVIASTSTNALVREFRGCALIDVDAEPRPVVRIHVTALDLRRTWKHFPHRRGPPGYRS
jgi:hypothetical protein